MPTNVVKYDSVAVLTSKEDLMRDSIDQFKHVADKCMAEGFHNLVIDFTNVDGIDSIGLETLLDLQDRCEDQLGCVRLCALNETIAKVLEITRLVRRFESFEDLDSAVRSFA